MNYFEAAALGLLQSFTEFLPVSSSGHLRVLEEFFGLREPETLFDIILHIGSLTAIFFYFRKEILQIFVSLFSGKNSDNAKGRGLFLAICVASAPTAIIGFLLGDFFENNLSSIPFVGTFLIINGFILLCAKQKKKLQSKDEITPLKAAIIGVSQGMAILRGISRSGTTITTAIRLGIKPEKAMSFSFLISIPAIMGALILKLPEIDASGIPLGVYLAGAAVSALSSFLALKILRKAMERMILHYFAPYSIAAGVVTLVVWIALS